jgi:hypothetical protein
MRSVLSVGVILVLQAASGLKAADIEGTVLIKHTLTKRHVTAAASSYQRGAAVPLGTDAPLDLRSAFV